MTDRTIKEPKFTGKITKAIAKRAVKLAQRVATPVRIKMTKISLLDVDPAKEGVWVKNTAIIFSDDDTVGYIHKPYFDKLVDEAYPKDKE